MWINDRFISTVYNGAEQINALFAFPEGAVKVGQDNVVTVLQDNMGNDEDDNGAWCCAHRETRSLKVVAEKSARGIPGFALNGGSITTWKVQGKVGGYLE